MTGGAGLEYGYWLKRPLGSRIDAPSLQARDQCSYCPEIFIVVRPEIQAGTLPCPACDQLKEAGLQQTVFVVTFFRPRVGKQNPEFVEGNTGGQRINQLAGLGLDEMAVGELGALCLALRAPDPVADHIHADTEGLGKFRGVVREEVAVPAADLESDGRCARDERGQLGAQCSAAVRDMLEKFRFGSHAPL